jgi:DNA-binding response OmpR family regulator
MAAEPLLIDDEDIVIGRSARTLRSALVIDGDPLVARSLALMFEAEGFLMATASSGAEGFELALETAFDLIILAADLPDMSGRDAMSRLRLAEVKAVMVFASVTPATMASAANLHLSDCSCQPDGRSS